MMTKKPTEANCFHCEHWGWYADRCSSYGGNCPWKEDCNRFKIKTQSESDNYDSLPPQEIVDEYYRLNPSINSKRVRINDP